MVMFLSAFYNLDVPKEVKVYTRGQYGKERCGGYCKWIITYNKPPRRFLENCIFYFPYEMIDEIN